MGNGLVYHDGIMRRLPYMGFQKSGILYTNSTLMECDSTYMRLWIAIVKPVINHNGKRLFP